MIRRIRTSPVTPNVVDSAGRPYRGPGRARLILVALTLLLGLVAATFAWRVENRNAAAREQDATDGVTAAARSTGQNALAGLSGAAGLVSAEGEILPEAFEAFRHDVARVSSLSRLAYIPVVPDEDRDEFEESSGMTILDLSDGIVPAPERDEYWPVGRISPVESLTTALLGVDIGSFPLTSEAARVARDSGDTVITEPLALEADLVTSIPDPAAPIPEIPESTAEVVVFFILKPLYLPTGTSDGPADGDATHAGFVASVYDGESLAEGARAELSDGVRFAIRDGEHVLARSAEMPEGGELRSFVIGGRTWTVHVEDARGIGHPLTLLIVGITLFISGGLVYLIRRSDRYERDTARVAVLIGRTGELARHLAIAASVGDVATVIARHVPAVFGARAASLGLVDRDTGTLRVHDGATASPNISPRNLERSLEDVGPLTEAVRSGDLVLREDQPDWWTYAAGAGVHEEVAAETLSAAGLPLEAADGTVVGAVAILWDRRNQFDDTTVATLRTVTELCEQSLHRADLTDQISLRAARLAELAERLAGATTLEEAARVATSLGREPVGAVAASVGITDTESGILQVHHGETVVDQVREAYANPPLDADLAFTEAARTGQVVLVPDYRSYVARYPGTNPANGAIGEGARAAFPLRVNEQTIGAIVFAWAGDRSFDDMFVSTLSTIAEMVAQSVQRARLAQHQVDDARHSRDLARLAEGLASRAHTEDVTGFLASSVITPLDAIHAAVGLVRDGALHRHYSGGLPVDLGEVGRRLDVTPLTDETPLTDAARTGEDVFVASTDELRTSYPAMVGMWESVGFGATANLALRDRTGTVIGALGIAWDHPVSFSKELRDRLTTIVGIAAQTLERAQLADMLRDTATRNELLADFAQHVAQARTVNDLCDAVDEHAGAPVGAMGAALGLVDEVTHSLRIDAHPGVDPSAMGSLADPGLGEDLPGPETVRTQTPVVLASPDEIAQRFPGPFATAMEEAGVAAVVALPLTGPGRSTLGVIEFAWRTPQQVAPASIATMRTIAELCAQTMERTRLGEAEHRLVSSLQNRVVTPLPSIEGLSISQRYRPAAHHVGMGGDWYDGIALGDGRYALVIGDIAGHGIAAVADMVQLRASIQALVRGGVGPGEVFPRASALLQENDNGVTASAFIAVFDPRAATVSYMAAGHPPPLLRTVDGKVAVMEEARQPLLGIPMAAGEPMTLPFPAGAALVAYTDGLIERRQEVIDESIDRLGRAVGAVDPSDIERMADELLDRCLGGREPEDDVALVVVRNDSA